MTSRDKSSSDNDKQNGRYRKFIEKSTVQFGCVDSSNEPWFLMLTNPIKITEFVLTLLLFGIIVYLITLPDPGLRQTTSIFVIGISIAFLFFDSIQIVAHFAGSDLPEYPMVFINFLGVIFYLAAGCALLYTAPVQTWGRLTSFMLCFMISVVHTIGFLIVLLIWRHRFCSLKKCHPLSYGQLGQIFLKMTVLLFFPVCAMENITAEIIEPYESKNYQVFQRPQYTERHHSVPDLSLQKQTETQAEVAHKSRTGSRPDDTTQSVKYREDLDQTGNQTCDICQRPIPEIARAFETTFGQADTSQIPLASSSPKYTRRTSSPRAISTPPQSSHISSPVRQSIQSSLQYTRGHRPGLHTYNTTIPNAIVVKPAPTPPPAPTVAKTTTTTSPTPAPTQPTSRAGPCCEFCNCASTICGKVHKLQHNKSQEQVQQQSQPSQVNQLHWACFTTAPGAETAIFDATGKQFGCDTVLNSSEKATMGFNAAYNTRPQMMKAAELSTTVGSIPKSLSDGSSSSFHVQKNKRTQTKSQVYRSVSEGSSDENEKKRYSKSRRKSKNSESTDINKINSIQETFEDNNDSTKPTQEKKEHEIKIETDKDDKSISNSRKRTKPLYRESSEKNDVTANSITNKNDDLNTSRRNSQSNQEDISDESLKRFRNTISPVMTPTSSTQQIKRNEDDNNNP